MFGMLGMHIDVVVGFLSSCYCLKSKDFGGTLSMIDNRIIELSCLCCQVHSFRCTPSVNELDSCLNSQDHIFPLKSKVFLLQPVTFVAVYPNEVPLSPRVKSQVGHACANCC